MPALDMGPEMVKPVNISDNIRGFFIIINKVVYCSEYTW